MRLHERGERKIKTERGGQCHDCDTRGFLDNWFQANTVSNVLQKEVQVATLMSLEH